GEAWIDEDCPTDHYPMAQANHAAELARTVSPPRAGSASCCSHPPGDRERAIAILGDALEEAGEYSMKGVQVDALALKLDLEASAPATPLGGAYSRKTGSGFVGCVTIQPAITFASVAWKPAFGKRVRTSRTNSAGRPKWIAPSATSIRSERRNASTTPPVSPRERLGLWGLAITGAGPGADG